MLTPDRLILHTVHTDEGATEVYFGRAADDHEVAWTGSLLFHASEGGGFTFKLWNQNDVPIVLHVDDTARIRVSATEDQPPNYDSAGTLFDSNAVTD